MHSMPTASPRSREREIPTKVGVDCAWRNLVQRGMYYRRQNTFIGVDNAVVSLSVVLSTPMHVVWRCELPFTTCFESNVEFNVTTNKKQESAD